MLKLGCIEEKGASSNPLEPDLWVSGRIWRIMGSMKVLMGRAGLWAGVRRLVVCAW